MTQRLISLLKNKPHIITEIAPRIFRIVNEIKIKGGGGDPKVVQFYNRESEDLIYGLDIVEDATRRIQMYSQCLGDEYGIEEMINQGKKLASLGWDYFCFEPFSNGSIRKRARLYEGTETGIIFQPRLFRKLVNN